MKVFHCDHCGNLVFFENVRCVNCDHALAYLPDLGVVGSLDPAGGNQWKSPLPRAAGRTYRLCPNYSQANVCNWAVPAGDANDLCRSCRLTRGHPGPEPAGPERGVVQAGGGQAAAGVHPARPGPAGAQQDRRPRTAGWPSSSSPTRPTRTPRRCSPGTTTASSPSTSPRPTTPSGRSGGWHLGEPYRTLLGHFRHEVGHYYWDRLIDGGKRLAGFRESVRRRAAGTTARP